MLGLISELRDMNTLEMEGEGKSPWYERVVSSKRGMRGGERERDLARVWGTFVETFVG